MILKPGRWTVSPGLTRPEWSWFWQGRLWFLPLWEGGGVPHVYTPHAKPLTPNTTNGSPTTVPGPHGYGHEFSTSRGDAYHIYDSNNSLPTWFPGLQSTPFTMLALVTFYDLSRTHNVAHFGNTTATTAGTYFFYGNSTNGLVKAWIGNTNPTSTSAVSANVPALIGSYWSGSRSGVIVNGNKEGEISTPSIYVGATLPFNLGTRSSSYSGTTASFNGILHGFWLFDRVLTQEQLLQFNDDPFGPLRWHDEAAVVYAVPESGSPYTLAVDSGSFALTGADATLLVGHAATAESAAYALTGTDVTLTYTPTGAYNLTADNGSFALTGTAADLLAGWLVTTEAGAFTLTGTAVTLTYTLSATLTQSAYRWRNDDGSETTATWAANESTAHSVEVETPVRLRVQIDGSGDPAAAQYQLEYKKQGDADWSVVN